MLQKQEYSQRIIEIFKNSSNDFPEINFEELTNHEIIQYGNLVGAKKVFNAMSKTACFEHLNLPAIHLYTKTSLNQSETSLRGQNVIFTGSPGSGKTFLSAKLSKDYFCNQFIPEKYRESQDFFNGEFAHGIPDGNGYRKIVFVNESHVLDMFSRNIQNISAQDHFQNYPCFGSWDLEDLSSADFLVVNDIGSRKVFPQYAETLFSIFDSRFEDLSKITIFTTNADKNSLSEIYGGPFVDRLKTLFTIPMQSDSKRKLNKIIRTKQKFEYYVGE